MCCKSPAATRLDPVCGLLKANVLLRMQKYLTDGEHLRQENLASRTFQVRTATVCKRHTYLEADLVSSSNWCDTHTRLHSNRESQAPALYACSHFGNKFCGTEKCEVVPDKTDAFVCRCERNDTYYDAAEGMCLFKRTCKTTECTYGTCIEHGLNKASCGCPNVESVSLSCKIHDWFIDDCKRKGGIAVLDKHTLGARCKCDKWAAVDRSNDKCVPTTCLRPDLTCKELCEKNWLEKDNRCCQGWSSADCSAAPPNGTYCSPGSIMVANGKCQDACTAKEAKFVCSDGCKKTESSARAYECRCKNNYVVAEDGITCKAVRMAQACSEEQKKTCLPSQTCLVEKDKIICACPHNHQLVNGECTSRCTENKCHENFTDCQVYMEKQSCSCPWTTRKTGQIYIRECTLNEYYYTVSFTPNISLDADNCNLYEGRVLEAMKTSIGTDVFKVEILNCTEKIEARLIASKPLSKYLLKRLQTCEHPDGDLCMLYPKLPIKKDTATEIVEENLCDSLLKGQEEAYKGQNECVKFENFFWFKCAAGFREVDRVTRGRLRRSVCEPGVSCTQDKELECASKGQICVSENEEPKCQCPPGMVTGQGGCSAAVVPESCNEEEINKCRSSGQRCVMENQKAVCKEASNTPATEGVDPAPSQCNEEMRKKCTKKGAECVTVDGTAICRCPEGKVETSQGCSDPGPSSAVSVSSTTLWLLAAMTAAAAAAA
ncbi:glycoprotein antigen BM86-like isoform X3 [Dermacentor albipictus]|uniref:glycoprotein antigen BM86-like isoform X3 n=1 Tax=Dermacentor albipictus TaxID=60249 RepID=UPI0031FC385D